MTLFGYYFDYFREHIIKYEIKTIMPFLKFIIKRIGYFSRKKIVFLL